MIQQLIAHHKNVCKEIEFLYERDHQPANLIRQLTRAIDAFVDHHHFSQIFCIVHVLGANIKSLR